MRCTHVTSKVLLPAQDILIHIELTFQLRDQLLDALFIGRLPDVLLDDLFPNDTAHDRIKLGILGARRLLELCSGLKLRRDQLRPRPERREVAADSAIFIQLKAIVLLLRQREGGGSVREPASGTATIRGRRETTHGDIGHLAERLVCKVRLLLVFARLEVDENEFIRDVAFFGYHGYATRASGLWGSVELERHSECRR